MGGTESHETKLEKDYAGVLKQIKGKKGIQYGNKYGTDGRPPVVMQTCQLSEELLQYLLKLPMFTCDEKEIESHGYFKCVDYPELTQHIYYEGYFHSKPTSKTVFSIHPRKGYEYQKPAAPLPLRAFYVAFRKINTAWVNDLKNKLTTLIQKHEKKEKSVEQTTFTTSEKSAEQATTTTSTPASTTEKPVEEKKNVENQDQEELEDAAATFLRLINEEHLFGDLAIQFHHGTRVSGDHLGWHTDAINSLLHMATAIRSRRALHSHRSLTSEEKDGTEYIEWQNPKDIYISSPALFMHSVEYPETPLWENRIVAIQARFLMTSRDLVLIRSSRFSGGVPWKLLLNLVTLSLAEAKFKIPTLEEVKLAEEELVELEKQEKLENPEQTTSPTSSTDTTQKEVPLYES